MMMNRAGCLLGLALIATTALPASAFAAGPQRLFGCSIDQSASDFISLYATPQDDGSWQDVHFIIEKGGIVQASVLEHRSADPRVFYFSNSNGPEGYYAQVRFNDAGRSYLLGLLDIPPAPEDENDMGGRAGVLTITEANGASYDLPCGETDEYIGYMQQAMACDMTNRYGVAGCDFDNRPMRSADDRLPASLQCAMVCRPL
jgi:hypothetical protein